MSIVMTLTIDILLLLYFYCSFIFLLYCEYTFVNVFIGSVLSYHQYWGKKKKLASNSVNSEKILEVFRDTASPPALPRGPPTLMLPSGEVVVTKLPARQRIGNNCL